MFFNFLKANQLQGVFFCARGEAQASVLPTELHHPQQAHRPESIPFRNQAKLLFLVYLVIYSIARNQKVSWSLHLFAEINGVTLTSRFPKPWLSTHL